MSLSGPGRVTLVAPQPGIPGAGRLPMSLSAKVTAGTAHQGSAARSRASYDHLEAGRAGLKADQLLGPTVRRFGATLRLPADPPTVAARKPAGLGCEEDTGSLQRDCRACQRH